MTRRTAIIGGLGTGAAVIALPSTANAGIRQNSPANPIAADGTTLISSDTLAVTVDAAFPRIVSSTLLATGATMEGNRVADPVVQINGVNRMPAVVAEGTASSRTYVMSLPEVQMVITARLLVEGDQLRFDVTNVAENGEAKLNTFWFPAWHPVSVDANQPGATLAAALLPRTVNYQPDTTSSDTITTVGALPVTANPQFCTLAFLHSRDIAVAIESNSIELQRRMRYWTREVSGVKATSIWNAQWTYRTNGGRVHALPQASFIFTGDRNGDGLVDWQDAAIAFRDIMYKPLGSEEVRKDVAFQVAINKNTLAWRPFLRTLDDIRKAHLYTDGLRQSIELKGYQASGHDTSHPDYGDNISDVAGGVEHLKILVREAGRLNCKIGVHLNATEQYLGAKNFTWRNTQNNGAVLGWRGQAQSFKIDQAKDQDSGDFDSRLQVLKDAVPDLSFIYLDVWQNQQPSPSAQVVTSIHDRGWSFLTEWETLCWPEPTWYHKSTWYKDQGINSKLIRMAYHRYKDVWLQHDAAPAGSMPLLRGAYQAGFMGFSASAESIPAFLRKTFTQNLPVKFLQHFSIMNYGSDTVTFDHGVTVTNTGNTSRIFQLGKLRYESNELENGESFIPWDTDSNSDGGNFTARKIYAWTSSGTSRIWDLPESWAAQSTVELYELTDLGKTNQTSLPVDSGQVRLSLKKDTPYVLYPTDPALRGDLDPNLPSPASVGLGSGDLVQDGYFYTQSLERWKPQNPLVVPTVIGDLPGAKYVGFQNLQFSAPDAHSVSQILTGLTAEQTYVASVYVAVKGSRRGSLSITPRGGEPQEVYSETSPWQNKINEGYQHGTNLQRMSLTFRMPAGTTSATLELAAAASTTGAVVWFNSVRVAPIGGGLPAKAHYYYEDFENLDQGWGPFIYSGNRGTPAEFVADFHEGYSRDVISGQHSLRSMDNSGPIWRTMPQTLRFEANRKYRISFRYLCDASDFYWVDFRSLSQEDPLVTVQLQKTSDRPLDSPPAAGNSPAGWTDTLPPQSPDTAAIAELIVDTTGFGDGYLQFNKVTGLAAAQNKSTLSIDELTVDVI